MTEPRPPSSIFRDALAFAAALLQGSRRALAATAALLLLGGLLEGVGLLLLVPLAGLLAGGGGRAQAVAGRAFAALGAETQLARLGVLLAVFVPVVLLRTAAVTIRDRRMADLQFGFVERRRVDLVRALAGARWRDLAGLHHARVTSAVGGDIGRVAAAGHYLLQGAVAALMLAVQWLLALLIAPALALVALLLTAAGAALLVPSLRRAGRLGDDLIAGQGRMMHIAGQFLAGLKPAMAQNAQDAFAADFAAEAQALTRRQLAVEHRRSLAHAGVSGAAALVGAAMLAIGVGLAVPVASLLAAIVIFSRMIGPATLIQHAAQQFAVLAPAHASLLALQRDLGRAPAARAAATPLAGQIVFERVSYAHGDGAGVSGLDLLLAPGEIVAVTGASGAGKTTFVDLLAGLLEPDTGSITVGGVPLDRHTAPGHRDAIAYVTQDTFLVHDTIRRNLTLGRPDPGEPALWEALTRAGADGLVRALPAGLDTPVAERGARLSGGERQRIALARALLRRPSLLVLDEATGAIDLAGEAAILAAVAALPQRPTVVIVAHRPQSLAPCTRRLTFASGRLIEDRRLVGAW